jgi:predicted RecA/RadA family phage recombinase
MRNCIRPDARSVPMAVPYASGVLSGQGMLVGAFFGVAASDAAQNATVECETRGEFELAKDPTQPMTAGARVFWDNTNRRLTTTATGNFQVGVVTVAALAADTTVRVMLARVPASGA